MPSSSVDRWSVDKLWFTLCVASVQWSVVQAAAFYYPSDGYQTNQYYYNVPSGGDSWAQPSQNGYYYSHPSNAIVPSAPQNENLGGRFNYYGVPGYEDYRTRQDNRYVWNDPYARRQWDSYYQRNYYYPSASADSWNDRRDGSQYYIRRRQDSGQPVDMTTQATTPVPVRPSVPRKKKLFVPNVWG
ncbi:AGAP005424-PA-like protein [Anopheles sinensis]|uniref:AGAP005424-PA-like protein n=1 Tax=Anopheles sinensis TaxID=74873 RepID=A0A084VDA0_ANOSI|nr:AGAP005424-PA-like protein [Anopheles sinensis]